MGIRLQSILSYLKPTWSLAEISHPPIEYQANSARYPSPHSQIPLTLLYSAERREITNGGVGMAELRLLFKPLLCIAVALPIGRETFIDRLLRELRELTSSKGLVSALQEETAAIENVSCKDLAITAQPAATDEHWRVTSVNKNFELCQSYEEIVTIPRAISDSVIRHASKFRSHGRFPILSYLHHGSSSAAICRSSQPLTGLLANRCIQDEHLLSAIRHANPSFDSKEPMPLLIVDARGSLAAFANSFKGAGVESADTYQGCMVEHMNLGNIHVVRDCWFKMVEQLWEQADQVTTPSVFLDAAQRSGWAGTIRGLLSAAARIVRAVEKDNQSVLIHCSDGWDRTSQLISLAKICLSDRFRSMAGFQELLQHDWLGCGHKFDDRLGHDQNPICNGPANFLDAVMNRANTKLCPIFDQFLECVNIIRRNSPESFEYNGKFLKTILTQAYSRQTTTLVANSPLERAKRPHCDKLSLWSLVGADLASHTNENYCGSSAILNPDCNYECWDELLDL